MRHSASAQVRIPPNDRQAARKRDQLASGPRSLAANGQSRVEFRPDPPVEPSCARLAAIWYKRAAPMRHSASLDTRICQMTARRSVGRIAAPPDVGVSCWQQMMDRCTNESALAGCIGTVWRSFGTNPRRSMRHSASFASSDAALGIDGLAGRPDAALGIDRPGREARCGTRHRPTWAGGANRRYPRRVLTKGLSNGPGSSRIHASLACQDLTRRSVCPAPGGSGCTPGPPRRMRGPVAIQHPARVPGATRLAPRIFLE
jgi:hypothetical protein